MPKGPPPTRRCHTTRDNSSLYAAKSRGFMGTQVRTQRRASTETCLLCGAPIDRDVWDHMSLHKRQFLGFHRPWKERSSLCISAQPELVRAIQARSMSGRVTFTSMKLLLLRTPSDCDRRVLFDHSSVLSGEGCRHPQTRGAEIRYRRQRGVWSLRQRQLDCA